MNTVGDTCSMLLGSLSEQLYSSLYMWDFNICKLKWLHVLSRPLNLNGWTLEVNSAGHLKQKNSISNSSVYDHRHITQ
jgi:hypothetical protein